MGGAAAAAPTEADRLDELGDEIGRMAAHIHAAMGPYLARVAEFDRRRGWAPGGHASCARWLALRTGLDLRTAREHVRVARARQRARRLSIVPDDDLGLYAVRGWVTPEVGAVLLRAVEAAADALYGAARREGDGAEGGSGDPASAGTPPDPCSTEPPSPRQRERDIPDDVWFAATEAAFEAAATAPAAPP